MNYLPKIIFPMKDEGTFMESPISPIVSAKLEHNYTVMTYIY
jgi:hypothetical protein